jgi:hypothetical protein
VPSHGATNSSLKCKQVKLLTHTPFTQSLKQSVPGYFPLKSWPALVPVDQNHIGHRRKGCVTLGTLQGSAGPQQRISPCRLLTLTTPSYLPGLDIQHGSPFHSISPRAWSAAPQPPSVVQKETPESHQGCALPSSRNPRRLQSQGAGTRYPTGLGSLISLGPPEILLEECRTSENKTQTQVVGGKEDLLC